GYFSAMGIEILEGRDFTFQDTPLTPRVVLINRSLARHYFGGEDPIGRTLAFVEGGRSTQIIGVVSDSKYYDLREKQTDFVYTDSFQSSPAVVGGALIVRATKSVAPLRTA